MRNRILSRSIVIAIALIFLFSISKAQSPGIIVRPAGGPYSSVLDPNQNGYTSSSTSGFVSNDIAESEIAYKVVPPAITEPTGDLATGPSGGFSDIVKTVDNSGFYVYSNGTNIYFRLRIGGIISGSKGYSVLIDTDGKMGNSGPNADPDYVAPTNTSNGNPGFEYEVVYETNFQVEVFNVGGTKNPVSVGTYSLSTNSQISVALSKDGGNPDYFYDWYVPLTAIGAPSSIRMAVTTVTSPSSALQGSRSDIYGINDATSSVASAWQTVVNAQPSISITGSGIASVGAVCTAAPVLNSPINPGSSISVSGTWTRMDASKPSTATITLYKNGSSVGTTSITTGSTWSISVATISAGDVFYAKAVASGETECLQSNNVTAGCTSTLNPTVLTQSSSKGICGSLTAGATGALIYKLDGTAITLMNSGNANMTYTASTFTWFNCSGGSSNVANGTYMIILTGTGCNSAPVFDCISSGASSLSGLATSTSITFPSTIYPYNTSISGTVPAFSSGTQLASLFVNNVLKTSVSIAANATTYIFSNLQLSSGDDIKVYLSGNGCTVYNSTTVSCYTQPPVITTDTSGYLLATTSATNVTGTSIYPGATVTLYKGTAPSGVSQGTATVNSSGVWSIAVSGLTATDNYYATQTYNSCTSPASASATVATPTTVCASFGTTGYPSTQTTISGTLDASFNGVVRLYLDGVQIGTTATLSSATTWSISSPFTYSLYPGGTLTVSTQSTNAAAKAGCNTATITCTSPSAPSISPTSPTINAGQTVTFTVSSPVSSTWYAVMDNTGTSYATSQYTTSTSNISLTTTSFGTPGTYNLKVSADQLTGCSASYTLATVLVNSTVLPVRFLNISAKKLNNQVVIDWSVADEKDIKNYIVERSNDCINFDVIGAVNYRASSTSANKYSFTDVTPITSKACYRIRQIDIDGNFSYSSIVSVAGSEVKSRVQPNPFIQSFVLNTFLPSAQPLKVQLLDMNGSLIRYNSINGQPGDNRIEFTDLGNLQAGIYMVRIIKLDSVTEQKIIKAKQ